SPRSLAISLPMAMSKPSTFWVTGSNRPIRGTSYLTPIVMLPLDTIWAIADPAGKVFVVEVAVAAGAEDAAGEGPDDAGVLLELLLELLPQAAASSTATAATPKNMDLIDFKTAPPILPLDLCPSG